jgi:hypothetical protein
MNRRGHLIFGGLVLCLTYFIIQDYVSFDYKPFIIFLPMFLIGCILPDEIENVRKTFDFEGFMGFRTHRLYLHSVRFLKIILIWIIPISLLLAIRVNVKYFAVTFLFYGWATHLFSDQFFTPSGLPR